MQILNLLWLWALLGLRLRIISPISLAKTVIVDERLSVLQLELVGSLLLLAIKEHCLGKKLLKSSAFSLKSIMKQSC